MQIFRGITLTYAKAKLIKKKKKKTYLEEYLKRK
jgi:hypothetical protein